VRNGESGTEEPTMTQETLIRELPNLTAEIHRYLDAVETFRGEDAGPTWEPEQGPPDWWASEHLRRRSQPERLPA
jgi:hypothetical protein